MAHVICFNHGRFLVNPLVCNDFCRFLDVPRRMKPHRVWPKLPIVFRIRRENSQCHWWNADMSRFWVTSSSSVNICVLHWKCYVLFVLCSLRSVCSTWRLVAWPIPTLDGNWKACLLWRYVLLPWTITSTAPQWLLRRRERLGQTTLVLSTVSP